MTTIDPQLAAELFAAMRGARTGEIRQTARRFAEQRRIDARTVIRLAPGLRLLARACSEDEATRLLAFDRNGGIRPVVQAICHNIVSRDDAMGRVANAVMALSQPPPGYLH